MAFEWVCALGLEGVRAEMDYSNKSLKAQMKRANRLGAPYVMIVGDDELKQGSAILRNMQTKEQESIPLGDIVEEGEGSRSVNVNFRFQVSGVRTINLGIANLGI